MSVCITYRVYLPVLATGHIEVAADTILAIKSARLDVPRHHHVKWRIRWLVRVFNMQVVAAKSEFILGVAFALNNILLEKLTAQVYLLPFQRQWVIFLSGRMAEMRVVTTCHRARSPIALSKTVSIRRVFVKVKVGAICSASASVVCHVSSFSNLNFIY